MTQVVLSEALVGFTGGVRDVQLDARSLDGLLDDLAERFPALAGAAFRDRRPARAVLVFVDGQQVDWRAPRALDAQTRVELVSVAFGG